jgi:hypothetical protein
MVKDFAGRVLDGGHNGVAMQSRPARENLQDEQIERAFAASRILAYLDF